MSNSKNRKLKGIIINHFQFFFIIIGLLCLSLSLLQSDICIVQSYFIPFLREIGTFFLSTSILTIAYEKWRDSNEKYYLMSEDKEYGPKLNKIDFYYYKPKRKIMPILKQDESFFKSYGLVGLIERNLARLKGTNIFIYGTTLGFLKNQDYKDAFIKAIRHGINFQLVMVDPFPSEYDINENKIKRVAQGTLDVIKDIVRIVSANKNRINYCKNGFIELRFVNSVSPNSFSSVKLGNRYVRTLDFNFENIDNPDCGLTKYSQVFDFSAMDISEDEDEDNNLSDKLYSYYLSLYQKSILALCYPCTEIVVYVCGVVRVYDNKINNKKRIITYRDKLPRIEIYTEIKNGNVKYYTPDVEQGNRDEYYGTMTNIDEYKDAIKNTLLDIVYVQYFGMTQSKIVLKEMIREKKGQSDQNGKYFFIGIIEDSIPNGCFCSYGDVLEDNELWEYFDKDDFKNTFQMI